MYKCNNCGHIFEEGEEEFIYETHGLEHPPYERFSVCPVCGGDFLEIKTCNVCGAESDGGTICDECLRELINYENALDFLEKRKELAFFIFDNIYNMECPKVTTEKFDEEMRMVYLRAKVEDLALEKKDFLHLVEDFIISEYSWEFSDFLEERGEI